jgi:predicted small lipoprotein YifL
MKWFDPQATQLKLSPACGLRARSLLTLSLGLCLLSLAGCGTSQPARGPQSMYLPQSDTYNTAPGAAYAGDAMTIQKPIPSRPEWKPLQFYYKHCTQVDSRVHYSKTSYDCMGPH